MNPAFDLESLARLSGVKQVVIGDDAGRLLDCAGWEEPPTAAILVLAHATLAAASELGRRSGSGDCLELIQQHEGGCIYLHALPHRRVLLVRCQDETSIPHVRGVCHRMSAHVRAQNEAEVPMPRPAASSPRISDLSSAFLAEPAW
ncbi:MAG TPA: roadblock/LC7 domain-containing protein [Prosthecobacter sp.]